MKIIKSIFLQLLKEQFWRILSIFLLIVAAVALEAASPFIYKLLIDNVLGTEPFVIGNINSPQELGVLVVILFFLIAVLSNATDYGHLLTTRVVEQKAISILANRAFRNLESFNIGFFRRAEIGDYIYRLSPDVYAIEDIIEIVISILSSAFFLVLILSIMFFISPKLTFISLVTIPFLAAIVIIFNKRATQISKRSEIANSTLFSFMQQALSQLKIIQAYSREKFMSDHFSKTQARALNSQMDVKKINYAYDFISGLAIAITYMTIFGYGISSVFAGELTTGLLIVFIYYIDNLTNPLVAIADNVFSLKQAFVRFSRLSDFFNEKNYLPDTGTIEQTQDSGLIFKNITLLGEGDFVILDDISCTIPANKITIIAGTSGSGKTSFLSLIPRLIGNPTTGKILLGNTDLTEYSLQALRDNIALVVQENSLFNQSIRDIIAFGNPEATIKEIHDAAVLACADTFILQHPQGYDFKVGEGGNYLSGGQRQRLMLARAFVKNADILLFDEPFSNLDEQTRKKVWHNIRTFAKGKTTIIVSNMLDFMSQADYMILLNNGRIYYEGDYDHLKNKYDLAKILLEGK